MPTTIIRDYSRALTNAFRPSACRLSIPLTMHHPGPRLPLRFLIAALAVVAVSGDAGAQRSRRDNADMRIVVDTTYRFAKGGLVDVEQVSGDITVTAWDRADIRVRAWVERGRVISELSSSRVKLRVEGERNWRGSRDLGESRYEIMVPVGTRVRAVSVSGDVSVTNSGSEVDASSVSGDVEVTDAVGLTSVASVSGDVRVTRVRGDLSVRSVSGDVTVREAEGDVRANSVSGELSLTGLRSRNVTAKTTSGDIDFDGTLDRDGRYQFNSHSGEVQLTLPENAGAEFSLRTFSGELDSAFPVTLGGRNRSSSRSMEFTLGNGGARITAETFSGNVTLRRASGRTRRP